MEGHKHNPQEDRPNTEVSGESDSFDSFMEGVEEEVAGLDTSSEAGGLPADSEQVADVTELVRQIDEEHSQIEAREAGQRREQEERRERGFEKIKPLQEQLTLLEESGDVFDGKLYYDTFSQKDGVYMAREASRLDSEIQKATIQIEIARVFGEETGESISGHASPEEEISKLEQRLVQLTKKKEDGFTDEEKESFSKGQRGILTGISNRGGISVPAINEGHLGYEGTKPVSSAKEYIEQMRVVREYRNTAEYWGVVEDSEDHERSRNTNDKVYGYHREAQGMAISALEAGDVDVAAQALKFAEGISGLEGDVGEKIKGLIQNLDSEKKKRFVVAFRN